MSRKRILTIISVASAVIALGLGAALLLAPMQRVSDMHDDIAGAPKLAVPDEPVFVSPPAEASPGGEGAGTPTAGRSDSPAHQTFSAPLTAMPQTSADAPPVAASVRAPVIVASSLFSGPEEIPPRGFLAYGILAFPERLTGDNAERGAMFCRAFLDTIPHSNGILRPADRARQEIVTLWPLRTAIDAVRANANLPEACDLAVPNYGLAEAQRHLRAAQASGQAGLDIDDDRGPFLLAWAPGEDFNLQGARMISVNLSRLSTEGAAREAFRRWMSQIAAQKDFYDGMAWHEQLRRSLRDSADTHGQAIRASAMALFGLSAKENDDA